MVKKLLTRLVKVKFRDQFGSFYNKNVNVSKGLPSLKWQWIWLNISIIHDDAGKLQIRADEGVRGIW